MWPALARWHGGGPWGRIFDHAPDGWEVSDWQAVDLAGASEHEDLCEAALGYYLERLRLAVDSDDSRSRLKILLVDEAWRFLRDPETAGYLLEAAKTWRKRNAALVLATQYTGDIVSSPAVRALVESCPTRLFLDNPAFPRAHADAFGLEAHEVDRIRELIPKSEIYLRRPAAAEVLRLSVDPLSYWLYTSSARDAERRSRLAARHGLLPAIRMLAGGPDAT